MGLEVDSGVASAAKGAAVEVKAAGLVDQAVDLVDLVDVVDLVDLETSLH
jgi:hypothetical protein